MRGIALDRATNSSDTIASAVEGAPVRVLALRLFLPLILLAQVAVGMTPGRVLCISLDGCGGHAHHDHDAGGHVGHEHAHGVCGGRDDRHHGDHQHGDHHHHGQHRDGHAPFGAAIDASLDACASCCCHLHISTPDDASAGRDRSSDGICCIDLAASHTAPSVTALCLGCASRMIEPPRCSPMAWMCSDQCRARETTRLLI